MPADFSRLVVAQFQEKVRADFADLRVKYSEIKCSSTPRRFFLLVNQLSDVAEDCIEERKGPPSELAFKNGIPTQAAIGFAKRCGLGPEQLEIRETPKGKFVFAKIIESGKPVSDLLIQLVPKWIGEIQGTRFMRWGIGERRFVRPVRWIVCLLDHEIVPFILNGCDPQISAGRISRGHRLYRGSLTISSASEYYSVMKKSGVQVDREARKSFIKSSIEEVSKQKEFFSDLTNSLLDELTDLVESPSLIFANFDKSFLNLPPEVLTTVMKVHQRYIPLFCKKDSFKDLLSLTSKGILAPSFLCVSNGLESSIDNIRKGNERVLKARLSDAKFFVESDLAISSEKRRDLLDKVSFAEDLGSLLDRVKRIEWIVDLFGKQKIATESDIKTSKRAAYFCKHDLVSHIVSEFPELEGIMGGKYLLRQGESKSIALAVLEHYLPRSTFDSLPKSEAGAILALAERFELLFSIFSKGERPTGSSDPFALRRAGNGILQILWTKSWDFNLNKFLEKSINHWSEILPGLNIKPDIIINDLSEFFHQRIVSLLQESGIDQDLVQAVAGDTISIVDLLSDPIDIKLRADLLSEMRISGKLNSIQAVVTRASRLADKSELPFNIYGTLEFVNQELFEKESEYQMMNVINSLEPIATGSSRDRYRNLANGLEAGSNALANFFDGDQSVMVMTDNLPMRTNRLNLLAILRNQATILADFTQISN